MPPKYVKKDPISHILDRPDMYVGSTRSRPVEEFVVIDDEFHIEKRLITISPAIVRLFIEPVSNIIDNVARSKKGKNKVTKIAIGVDEETGSVSLWNDGEVVPIEMHEDEKCYNHTMIFGQLLTGSNYDDNEDREDISGRNGLGIKAVNVFSKKFTVEGVDPVKKKAFKQTWTGNMRKVEEPTVKSTDVKKGYTKIVFTPDFSQFGLNGFTDDILALYKRIVVDMAMITKVPVFFNDEEVPVKTLQEYSSLYSTVETKDVLYVKTPDCEVVLTPSHDFQAISFANGIWTPLGGTHVDAWAEAFFRPIIQKLNKPKKPQVTIADVKKFFRLFVVASVKKPEFDSQSKTRLEAPAVEANVKPSHITAIFKWSVMEKIEDIIRGKEMMVLKKAERKKRGYEKVEGLERANNEGTAKSTECILILVEGLSAKTYASWGIQRGVFGKKGRDYIGILSLRGKILNCRNAKPVTVAKNAIISDIIKAVDLRYGVDYTLDQNYKNLRYGKILIVTDADTDGIHISALIQNMCHSLFPSILERDPPFITAMQTPIVRVYHGKNDTLFYDEQEYRRYVAEMGDSKKINKKYYKGLGTSSESDVKETFGQKIVQFRLDDKTFDAMNKAFNSKHADMRKEWLESYDPGKTVLRWKGNTPEVKDITFADYIDTELIKFSIDDCKRSIPNLIDGLKEGHRKVLYVTFLRNQKYTGKTIKVAQLAGSVAEKSGYHHGEQNLYTTITNMANAYVGSNNIPLLYRDGGFGTRQSGGKDAANGRYIFTKLDALTRLIFRAEDDVLLEHVEDDGEKVEPRFYVPIIPMILVNGVIAGIGTGWSCSIPCYNPLDLVASIKVWLEKDGNVFEELDGTTFSHLPEIKPWYRDHTGEMVKEDETKYVSWGKVEEDAKGNAVVTELPVGMWTDDFTEFLEDLRQEKQISTFKNHSTPKVIHFTIKPASEGISCDAEGLKLYKYIRTSNMVLFCEKGTLRKYNNTDQIIDAYCTIRYEYYVKRKKHILKELENRIKFLGNKRRFLEEVRDGEIKLFDEVRGKKQSRSTTDIVKDLEKRGYDKDQNRDNSEEEEEEKSTGHGYEYLLRLQISSITAEKIIKLKNDIANSIQERDDLQGTSEKELWLRELEEFESEYKKWLTEISKEDVGEAKQSKKKK